MQMTRMLHGASLKLPSVELDASGQKMVRHFVAQEPGVFRRCLARRRRGPALDVAYAPYSCAIGRRAGQR